MISSATPSAAPESVPLAGDPVGRAAVRKASLRLLPMIALAYGINIMDRTNISFASLSMNRELHFSASVYGLGAGLFFLGYAACEVPSNLILYRVGARRWLARIMITWGLLATLMLFVRTPTQFYALRILLGIAEAGFFPGVAFYLTQWFPADTRARVMSRFYVAAPLSTVVSGIIAGALLNLNGRLGLAGWQWLFLVEGLPAVILGIVFFIVLPDAPANAKWLTSAERSWIASRVHQDSAGTAQSSHSIGAALGDTRVWQMGVFQMLTIGANFAVGFSAPDIVQRSTHLATTQVGFVIAALYLLAAGSLILNSIHSDRTLERYWHMIVPAVLTSLSFLACGFAARPSILLPALACFMVSYWSIPGPFWSLPGSFFSGRSAATGIAAINAIGLLGGFLGPYAMGIAKDLTGTYQRGLSLMSIPTAIAACLMLYMRQQAKANSLKSGQSAL